MIQCYQSRNPEYVWKESAGNKKFWCHSHATVLHTENNDILRVVGCKCQSARFCGIKLYREYCFHLKMRVNQPNLNATVNSSKCNTKTHIFVFRRGYTGDLSTRSQFFRYTFFKGALAFLISVRKTLWKKRNIHLVFASTAMQIRCTCQSRGFQNDHLDQSPNKGRLCSLSRKETVVPLMGFPCIRAR